MLEILLLTGDAGEAQEIYYPKYRLEEEGWRVRIAAPQMRAFRSVVHDFEPGFDTYSEKLGYLVQADLGLEQVRAEAYHGLVLPGGRAPEYLRNRAAAVAIVRHFVESGKPIAANCHGPLLLLAASSIKGRTMTCYPRTSSWISMPPGANSSTARWSSTDPSSPPGDGRITVPG